MLEALGVVLPVEFGSAGLGCETEEFGDAGKGGGPGLFGAGGGVGGGFVGGGLEQEAGDDHGQKEDEHENGEQDEAATLGALVEALAEGVLERQDLHGFRVGSGMPKGSAFVSERAASGARPEGMRTTRRKRS